jgi:GMP synthase (glutamine-hydrolysing)
MSNTARFLVAESETEEDRRKRIESTGRSSGESYVATLKAIVPDAHCDIIQPVEPVGHERPLASLSDYDAVFLTGSPLHVYKETPEVRRQLDFMRAVFEAGTPSFGSCAGLQVAVAAAGGIVRENKRGHEVAFARRIVPTEAGRSHPLLRGRPAVFDAASIHSDEIERLPSEGALLLATNGVTKVQAAEVRMGHGVFWGVQYHPELPLSEVADAIRRQREDIIEQGLASDQHEVETYAAMIEALGQDPARRDLAWRLGLDEQVTDTKLRRTELRNFIEHLVLPTRSRRSRA